MSFNDTPLVTTNSLCAIATQQPLLGTRPNSGDMQPAYYIVIFIYRERDR